MMGPRQVEQGALFYNFSLDRHVPADHLLRSVDRFIDLAGLRRELAPFYSETGGPSVDPELMIRMLILGVESRHLLERIEDEAIRIGCPAFADELVGREALERL